MSPIRFALALIKSLLSRFTMVVVGAAIALVLAGIAAVPDSRPAAAGMSRALLSEDGENYHVALPAAEGSPATNLVVHDASGQPQVRFRVYRDGTMTIEPTGTDLVRFIVHRDTSGSVEIGVGNGNVRVGGRAQPDGAAEVLVTQPPEEPVCGMRITKEGKVLPHEFATRPSDSEIPPLVHPRSGLDTDLGRGASQMVSGADRR